ncbi:hypothetical protein ACFWUU_19345 [Kribbella sp. NPDC058693]|uniref:hypothetical protein n=1 Tax=Kribbella sp. NPDC058693 TaxID=3346602 RepID=UPI00364871F6
MSPRQELLDALVDDATRTALGATELSPEDRVLARLRVQDAIERTATRAHGDVIALAHGDGHGPEAERFVAHLDTRYQEQGGPDPALRDTAAGRLAAELVASDDRTKGFHPLLKGRAEDYIAHSVTVAAQEAAQKLPHGPSQARAAAGAAAAAGADVVAAPIDIATSRLNDLRAHDAKRGGPSIG